MEENVLSRREINDMRALCHRETSGSGHVLGKTRNGINLHVLRTVTCEAHHDGDIGRMTFSGQGE